MIDTHKHPQTTKKRLFKDEVAAFVALFNFAGSSAYCLSARAAAAAAGAGVGAALFSRAQIFSLMLLFLPRACDRTHNSCVTCEAKTKSKH